MSVVEAKRLPILESLGDNTLRVDLPSAPTRYGKITILTPATYDESTGQMTALPVATELWLNFDQVCHLTNTLITAQERWPVK